MTQTALAAPALRIIHSGRTGAVRLPLPSRTGRDHADRHPVAGNRNITIMEPDAQCAAMLSALLRANGFVPEVHSSFEATWAAVHDAPSPYAIIAASDRIGYGARRVDGVTLLDCFRTARSGARTRLMLITDDPYLETIYREDREVLTLGKPLIPGVILAFLGVDRAGRMAVDADALREVRPRPRRMRQVR